MLHGGGIALARSPSVWRISLVFLVIAIPVPTDGPTLEEVESGCAKGPQQYVDEIDPPSDTQPFLVD